MAKAMIYDYDVYYELTFTDPEKERESGYCTVAGVDSIEAEQALFEKLLMENVDWLEIRVVSPLNGDPS